MLKSSQRLSTQGFSLVMKDGQFAHSPLFTLRFVVGQASLKIAAVAPVKIAKTAVLRNQIRRRIYESVRPLVGGLKEGYHIIILAKQPAITSTVEQFSKELASSFKKAHISKD